ncbi:PI31_Prot_N domain-containing protein [Psidium guajava]|nr:PI31_Prot_N domain-containing protein [Psidium guajava]
MEACLPLFIIYDANSMVHHTFTGIGIWLNGYIFITMEGNIEKPLLPELELFFHHGR